MKLPATHDRLTVTTDTCTADDNSKEQVLVVASVPVSAELWRKHYFHKIDSTRTFSTNPGIYSIF